MEDELQTEGLKGEFDRKQASKSLASTLNKLIDKLDPGEDANKGDKEQKQPVEDVAAAAVGEDAAEDHIARPAAGMFLCHLPTVGG